jgi:hypothetical protein
MQQGPTIHTEGIATVVLTIPAPETPASFALGRTNFVTIASAYEAAAVVARMFATDGTDIPAAIEAVCGYNTVAVRVELADEMKVGKRPHRTADEFLEPTREILKAAADVLTKGDAK